MSWISSHIESQIMRRKFADKLLQIGEKNPTADAQGKSECCRSGVCCWRRPGCLAPEDVPAIAAHLGMTEKEMFERKLVVDEIDGVTCLLPARRHQEEEGLTGAFLSCRETYSIESPCTFLGPDNECQIHDVKPHDCRQFKCWEDKKWQPIEFPAEQLKALGWDGIGPADYDFEGMD